MMSVYKRGGKWYFSKTIDGVRYKRAIKTARNKVHAQQAEAKFILQIHQGEYGGRRATLTLSDFVDKAFLPWAKANRRSWRGDEGRLKALKDFFGRRRLGEINPFLIERYKMERRKSKLPSGRLRSSASINRELSLLSRIFSIAIKSKEATANPCEGVRHVPGEQPRTRYLLPEEEDRLMAVLTGPREHLRSIVILAINTGMRRGELLGLRWEHIDFHRNEIKVIHTKTDRDRFVPMNTRVRKELLSLRDGGAGEFVFPNRKTGRNIADVKTAFKNACRTAGIVDLHFHDLRHTFGTRAADAGVPINAIAAVMGHADIHTTMRYSHATDEGKRRAVEAIHQAAESRSQIGPKDQLALVPKALNG